MTFHRRYREFTAMVTYGRGTRAMIVLAYNEADARRQLAGQGYDDIHWVL